MHPGAEERRPAWKCNDGIGTREERCLCTIFGELASDCQQRSAVLVSAEALADQLPISAAYPQVQNDQIELPFDCSLVTSRPIRCQFDGVAQQLKLL